MEAEPPYQYTIHCHYSTMVAPMIMVATIFGIAEFGRTMIERRNLVLLVVGAAMLTAHLWGPTPIGRDEFVPVDPNSAQARSVREAIGSVPGRASISAHYSWIPQVAHRTEVYMFPNPWKAANWGPSNRRGSACPSPTGWNGYCYRPSSTPSRRLSSTRFEESSRRCTRRTASRSCTVARA